MDEFSQSSPARACYFSNSQSWIVFFQNRFPGDFVLVGQIQLNRIEPYHFRDPAADRAFLLLPDFWAGGKLNG